MSEQLGLGKGYETEGYMPEFCLCFTLLLWQETHFFTISARQFAARAVNR